MDLYEQYKKHDIIREGHFLLSHGRHSRLYIDKDRIYRSPVFHDTIYALTRKCETFKLSNQFVVTGPAVAGAVLAAPVWAELDYQFPARDISFVYPEKIDGKMTFRRGYDEHLNGKTVLLIEDIVTTGASLLQTAEAVNNCGGKVFGAVCIWNRSSWFTGQFLTHSLINKFVQSWPSDSCPMCEEGEIPLTDPKEVEVCPFLLKYS